MHPSFSSCHPYHVFETLGKSCSSLRILLWVSNVSVCVFNLGYQMFLLAHCVGIKCFYLRILLCLSNDSVCTLCGYQMFLFAYLTVGIE